MPLDFEAVYAQCQLGVEDLHPRQETMRQFMHEHAGDPGCAIFAGMGTGKTGGALTYVTDLIDDGFRMKRGLIVAPMRVARQTWPAELAKWRHTVGISHTVIRGEEDDDEVLDAVEEAKDFARSAKLLPARKQALLGKVRTGAMENLRRKLMQEDTMLHVINVERIPWLVDRCAAMKWWPYDTVILDELSKFKDHGSQRWLAMREVRKYIKRMVGLTASPVAEGYLGLFAQMWLLDQGERLGNDSSRYTKRYFEVNNWSRKVTIKDGAEEQITAKISDITIVIQREKEIVQPIPRFITLNKHEMKRYQDMEENSVLELDDDTFIEAINSGALHGKLSQMASGAVYDGERRVHFLHNHKIDELRQVMEEAMSPILLGYWYKPSLARIREAFPACVPMDKQGKVVGPWNRGEIDLMPAHPAGSAYGLNLQTGPGHIVAWFDLPDSYELYEQFVGRLDRDGQKQTVLNIPLVARGTVDEDKLISLLRKENAQNGFKKRVMRIRKAAGRRVFDL